MTVNHDVAGSSPAGGAKTKERPRASLLFWPFSFGLNPSISEIAGISAADDRVDGLTLASRQILARDRSRSPVDT